MDERTNCTCPYHLNLLIKPTEQASGPAPNIIMFDILGIELSQELTHNPRVKRV
jgi:hypothetical protein